MNFRERTLAVLSHQPVDGVVFQPRIEHWYNVNRNAGTLPERYRGMSILELYDDLGVSARTYDMFNPCLKAVDDTKVKTEFRQQDDRHFMIVTTPVGTLETHWKVTSAAWHTDKFPVVTSEDACVMEYVLESRTWEFDNELFERNDAALGNRAEPMVFIQRVNIQRLFIDLMGFENTLYALADEAEWVEHLMEVINRTDDLMLETVARCPVRIINYGDNLDQHFLPPNLFERYVLPEYRRRSDFLRQAGKLTFAHWDGSARRLLPYAQQTHMDGVEALTPLPQGDMTIPEIKDGLGEMVLLDGVPMTWFLPHEKVEDLEQVTREVIETFHPNLILGISDELSPVCDIEKVRRVAQIARDYEGV